MIEASISNIERGTQIAQRTADALDKIVEDVGKVASLMENIAIASKEQASGIAQVNEGITIVSEVVQKNSATAEESASASEELSGQAQNLKEHIKLFKLKKSDSEKNALSTTATTIPKPEKSDIKTHEYKADVNAHVNDQEKENKSCENRLSDSEFDKY